MSIQYYSAYGSRLSSNLDLPELRSVEPGAVRWSFRVVDDLPAMTDPELLGEEPIYSTISAKFFGHAAGYRICIDDTGAYDLLNDGSDIRWKPNDDPWWDFGRGHLIGRVLATCLQLSDIITLHASAVLMSDGVVGFLAPKHYGKSTLAMMLLQSGARFVTDDSLPVRTAGPVLALPGIQSLRVRAGDADSERLIGEGADASPGRDGKSFLPPFPLERVLNHPSAISALYFLNPVAAEAVHPAERVLVPPVPGSIRLLSHAKIGAMLGTGFAQTLLEEAGTLASSVPLFDLRVVRDLEQLPRVIDQLVEWHGLPGQVAEAG